MNRNRTYLLVGGVGYLFCLVGWVITQSAVLQALGLPFLLIFLLAALAAVVSGLRGKR